MQLFIDHYRPWLFVPFLKWMLNTKKPAYLQKPTKLLKIQVTLMFIFNSYENIIINNEIITCIIKRKQESGFCEWNGSVDVDSKIPRQN